jgi:hypothetical protein
MVLKEGHRAVGPPIFACTKGTDTHTHTHTLTLTVHLIVL